MSTSRVKGDVLALDPAALPATGAQAGEIRVDAAGDPWRWNPSLAAWVPLGSGGGGGGSAINWIQFPGGAPIASIDAQGDEVYLYEVGLADAQKLRTTVKVPNSYITGTQAFLKFLAYSPSAANNWQFTSAVYLVEKTSGLVTSPVDTHVITSGDFTNAASNRLREVTFELTNASGEVGATAIEAGDLLQIELYRGVPGGTDDTNAVRFYPSTTELLFS
jgi:hypothetical protein